MKAGTRRDTCIPILKGAQEPNNGNTPVSISRQMDKQNIADIQWNTSLIRKDTLIHATTWLNLEDIVLTKKTQTRPRTLNGFSCLYEKKILLATTLFFHFSSAISKILILISIICQLDDNSFS